MISSKKIIVLFLVFSTFYLLFSTFVSPVFADTPLVSPIASNVQGTVTIPTITDVVANIIKLVLGFIGVLALIFFIYGGLMWITSAGNAEQVKKGKGAIIWATLGLAMVFLSYSIVTYVIGGITGGGGSSMADPDAGCKTAGGECKDNCSSSNCFPSPKGCVLNRSDLCQGSNATRLCCSEDWQCFTIKSTAKCLDQCQDFSGSNPNCKSPCLSNLCAITANGRKCCSTPK